MSVHVCDRISILRQLARGDCVCCLRRSISTAAMFKSEFRVLATGIMGDILSTTHLVPRPARGRAISTGHDMASWKRLSLMIVDRQATAFQFDLTIAT